MASLGVNIGSSNLKLVLVDNGKITWSASVPHEGNLHSALSKALWQIDIPASTKVLVTGNEGRYLFNAASTLEPLCVEAAIKELGLKANALAAMGGEDLIVYSLDTDGKIQNNFSGNKCASGTGEFLKQQLGRMDMTFDDIDAVPESATVLPLSTRCSVFMKSDCTHRLNKREATKHDIVVSLSNVMAGKVTDFLKRAKITEGHVILTGGLTLNKHIVRFIKQRAPHLNFVLPETAPIFEAYGAAILADSLGSNFLPIDKLLKPKQVRFDSLPDLKQWQSKVKYFEKPEVSIVKGKNYILGVDGGSTTTKVCLVDIETDEVAASYYGRTHGDPVKAVKECLSFVRDKIIADTGDINSIDISLAATTGSSREVLGVFLETQGVYNEIIAHSVGTAWFDPSVETIFEIGGQDAKYVLLKNGVPIDYAMNEACSAGTGSFLEESASGDLSIRDVKEIGTIALAADAPLKFGEHCSAFINSDIRKAVQQGASKENITAGIVTSIVANYLNRVVGSRTIGNKVFLQGGVAKNKAVPLAFAMMLNKEILVPPSPELMGAFGVALLAKRKYADGLLKKIKIDIDALIQREIIYKKIFKCKSCDNFCPIQILEVGNNSYMFGGRCNKYTNTRKAINDAPVTDYIEKRNNLLFNEYAAPSAPSSEPVLKRNYTVGIPRSFSTHSFYPLYSWFFYELGIKTILSTEVAQEGVVRVESAYCFPAEIAHGAVQDCIDKGCDYILVPHFRDMDSYETDVHANTCPITQGLPYYIKKAFPELNSDRFLPLVVSFKFGDKKALELFCVMTKQLGISEDETKKAFKVALEKQRAYFSASLALGEEALSEAKKTNKPVIAILGRPYNAFAQEANMGIPRKFTSRGYMVVPFDILPIKDAKNQFPNMYWYYGQQDMKAAELVKNIDNIFVTWISNFSCAPDSFMLHYLKWIMGQKPFLILELDSHSADAGIDTRVEAFLDIIDGYRTKKLEIEAEKYDNGWKLEFSTSVMQVVNHKTGEKVPVKNNGRVKMLISNMGEAGTEYIAATMRGIGISAIGLPPATSKTIQAARAHASGKECVPSHLVLGGALEFLASAQYRKDELYLLFVPITTGPCRTGQYFVFYENLFRDLRLENIIVFTLSADNSYTEFGAGFVKELWKGLVVSDYLKDIHNAIKVIAKHPEKDLAMFTKSWQKMMDNIEKTPSCLWTELKRIASDLKTIEKVKAIEQYPKVLVVGEIYVRRDDFAVGELTNLLSDRGIVVKVSGICEWIHYLDFVREYALNKLLNLQPKYKRWISKPKRDLLKLSLESWWKHSIEKKVLAILEPTGFIPKTPHDMHHIMANTQEHFVNLELNSEIAVSCGVAATAMLNGNYSGVVNISPFACLIGRVIEGLFAPWARERGYPLISLEVDGNQLPPGIINKLNIFMVNVLRFNGGTSLDALVDEVAVDDFAPSRNESCDDCSACDEGCCGCACK